MTSRRVRGFGIALGAAFLAIVVTALLVSRREPESVAPSSASGPAPDAEPSRARPAAVVRPAALDLTEAEPPRDPKAKTGRSLRLRRPDGSLEVVDETVQMRLDRENRLQDAVTRYDAARDGFHHRFEGILHHDGPAAAWKFLAGHLRATKSTVEDQAEVCEALHLAAEIQADLGRASGKPSRFEPIREPATSALAALLVDRDLDPGLRRIALGHLAGVPMIVAAAGGDIGEEGGLVTYDPEAPVEVMVHPHRPVWNPRVPLPAIALALQSAEVSKACLKIVQDESEPSWIRAEAIRALGSGKDTAAALDPAVLARDPDPEIRGAAVDLLGLRPETVTPQLFFSLLDSQDDPSWKRTLFERISASSFGDPRMISALTESLPKTPPQSLESYPDTFLRTTVLRITLERYGERKEAPMLNLLTGCLPGWAAMEWPEAGSPLVTLAEFAAKRGLREFGPPLKSVLGSMPSDADRRRVEAAVARLGS